MAAASWTETLLLTKQSRWVKETVAAAAADVKEAASAEKEGPAEGDSLSNFSSHTGRSGFF